MKRFFLLVAAVAVLLPGRISAQTETGSGMPFNMSAGLSLGIMDGLGAELAFGVLDNLNVRTGYSFFPNFLIKDYDISLPKWAGNPDTKTAFSGSGTGSANLLVDYHPAGGSFRVTAGFFFGPKDILKVYNTKALPESYHSAGINYYVDGDRDDLTKYYRIISDDKGIMSAAFKSGVVRPFVGVGFGSAIPRNRVGVSFDLGVEYVGSLDLQTDARSIKGDVESLPLNTAGLLQTIYEIRGNSNEKSYDKYINYVDKLRALPVLPVARFSVFVKLF